MADFGYEEVFDGGRADLATLAEAKPPVGLKRLTNRAGAVFSIALILGMAVWGFQIAVRQARGVPLIQAQDGAMRIKPEDPGGVQVAHQGLSVNNVAAEGEVAAPPERLMLAPRPVELSEDDVAGYAPMPASAVVPSLTPTIPAPDAIEDEGTSTAAFEGDDTQIEQEPEVASEPVQASTSATVPILVASPASPESLAPVASFDALMAAPPSAIAGPTPQPLLAVPALAVAGPDALPDTLPDATATATAAATATPAAIATSIRPQHRPGKAGSTAAPDTAANASWDDNSALATQLPLDAATIAKGTRLVQLGAYDDAAAASRDWAKLVGLYAVYFEGKRPVIQKAQSGGKTFFRLRALGFADEDAARRFCAVLLNDRAQCIPVLTRG